MAFNQRHTEQDLRLFAGKRDVAALCRIGFDGRDGVGGFAAVGQAVQHVFHKLVGLFAVDVADDGDDGVVFAVAAAVESADVVKVDFADALRGDVGAAAVWVVGIGKFGQGASGGEVGGGFLLLEGGHCLFLTAVEHGGVKTGVRQGLVEQSGGFFERFGAAQAAQDGGRAFLSAAAVDLGGNVVGGGIKGFFVQLFRAVGQQGGGEFRHFAFAFGVEHAARAFEVDLHIDDGVVVLLDQKDFCAVAGGPALDVHACLRGGGEGEG